MEENIGMRIFSAKHQEMVEQIHGFRITAAACLTASFHLRKQSPDGNKGSPPIREMKDLLNDACKLLIREYEALSKDEYLLSRSLVEYTEIVNRETDRHSKVWSPYVIAELKYLEVKLLKSIALSPPIIPATNSVPQNIKDVISCCDKLVSAMRLRLSDEVPNLFKEFRDCLHMLSVRLFNKFSKVFKVGSIHVDKAQSCFSGIPLPWLEKSEESKDIKTFRSQLCQMVHGHDSIIDKLANTLFSPVLESKEDRPWAFLFLGQPGIGMGHVVKAMSIYLFRSELLQLDVSEATPEKLIKYVQLKPYCILYLRSFGEAPSSIRDSINRILTDGKLVDGDGHEVDFTKTMIIITSDVVVGQLDSGCPFFPRILRNPEIQHVCSTSCSGPERVIQEAKKLFDSVMLDRLDGIHVFRKTYSEVIVARLILRDMAMSMMNNPIAIYPSSRALESILSSTRASTSNLNGHALKGWLIKNVYPAVRSNEGNRNDKEFSAICIDTLVGTNELSYRKELHGTLLEEFFRKKRAMSWRKLKAIYKGERKVYKHIVAFREKWSNPVLCIQMDDTSGYNHNFIRLLESFQTTLYSMIDISNESPPKQVRYHQLEQEEIHVLRRKSGYRSRGRNLTIDIIMEAVFMSTNAPADPPLKPATTLMLLGFGSNSIKEIITGLLKVLSFTRGLPVMYVDMSKHDFVTKLFKASNPPAEVQGIGTILPSITEAVEAWPYCVVFLDKVENASPSDYSYLLRILDTGMLDSGEGYMVDFRRVVIILTSDLGRKGRISDIFLGPNMETIMDDVQKEESRFRSELLARVDEVILANPSSPREIARVDMKNGQHLRMSSNPSAIFFYRIFEKYLTTRTHDALILEMLKFYLSIKIEKEPGVMFD